MIRVCRLASSCLFSYNTKRALATHATSTHLEKAAGDISSVFPSLKPGEEPPPLPQRFAALKRHLIQGYEDQLSESWFRLLAELRQDIESIKELGSKIIPEISYKDLYDIGKRTKFRDQLHKRGVAVVRGVVSEREASGWGELLQRYIRDNPSTKGRNLI